MTKQEDLRSFTIRAAVEADMATLGEYGAQLMALHSEWDNERFIPVGSDTPGRYAAWMSTQLGRKDVVVLVAEDEGSVIGYAYGAIEGVDYMALRGPAGVVHDIFVDPARREQGIGKVLLDTVLARLEALGAPQITISTAYKNHSAQRLFERAGFRHTMLEMTRSKSKP